MVKALLQEPGRYIWIQPQTNSCVKTQLIGFAGPRVIKETIGKDLPKGFQRSEFLMDKGFVDKVVSRQDLKETVSNLIDLMT